MIIALSTIASFGLLWLVLYLGIRPLLVTAHRQRLFALRDELFDLARAGEIGFSDPAYARLRRLLNGQVRFADSIDFLTFLTVSFLWPRNEDAAVAKFEEGWADAMRALNPDVRRKLASIRMRMHLTVAGQLISADPLWWPIWAVFIVAIVAVAFLGAFAKSTQEITRRTLARLDEQQLTVQERLEATALACTA